jgi:hypothetical protein
MQVDAVRLPACVAIVGIRINIIVEAGEVVMSVMNVRMPGVGGSQACGNMVATHMCACHG